MAGADRGSVVAMVLREAFWQVGIGLGIGIPAAIGRDILMATSSFGFAPGIHCVGRCTVLLGSAGGWSPRVIPSA